MSSGFLQIFLLINAALIGFVASYAVRHALAHFRPDKHDAEKHHAPAPVKLPPDVRQALLQKAAANYEKILETAAGQLQLDLSRTSAQLTKRLETLGNQMVDDEMKRYQASLEQLQKSTEVSITGTQDALNQHQEDLKAAMEEHQKEMLARMNEEIAAEKERLLAQIDTRLADAAASFLIDTLQHEVDLGAQSAYLTKMIEEHKDEFKKEVANEAA